MESKKSGRTPEQQAARDARKAAKLAAAASAPSTATGVDQTDATVKSEPNHEPEAGPSKKSKVNEEDYEIDINAPLPLSKAEIRAAKRRAKRGEPEPEPAVTTDEKPKKRKRLASFDPVDGDADKVKGEPGEKSGKGKIRHVKQNSIWIGNLSYKTTPESLTAWLEKGVVEQGGTAGCVTRVNLPKQNNRAGYAVNKGYAYVDFTTPELQQKAVALSEKLLEGRKLLIKLGNDHAAQETARTPKPNPMLKNQPHSESATLFVGNLPFDATEIGLRDLIESNAPTKKQKIVKEESDDEDNDENNDEGEDDEGDEAMEDEEEDKAKDAKDAEDAEADEIEKAEQAHRGGQRSGLRKVRLGAFEDTGKCKGFAFLDFLEPSFATIALLNRRNHMYNGRKLTLQYASQDAAKRAGGRRNRDAEASGRGGRGGGRGGARVGGGRGPPRGRPDARDGDGDDYESGTARMRHDEPKVDAFALARQVLENTGGHHDEAAAEGGAARRDKKDQRGKKWEAAGRARPGAALAMAKREKVGIVAGQGTKISFD